MRRFERFPSELRDDRLTSVRAVNSQRCGVCGQKARVRDGDTLPHRDRKGARCNGNVPELRDDPTPDECRECGMYLCVCR